MTITIDPMPTDWLGRPAPWMRDPVERERLMRLLVDVRGALTPRPSDAALQLTQRERARRKNRNKTARMSRRNNRRG